MEIAKPKSQSDILLIATALIQNQNLPAIQNLHETFWKIQQQTKIQDQEAKRLQEQNQEMREALEKSTQELKKHKRLEMDSSKPSELKASDLLVDLLHQVALIYPGVVLAEPDIFQLKPAQSLVWYQGRILLFLEALRKQNQANLTSGDKPVRLSKFQDSYWQVRFGTAVLLFNLVSGVAVEHELLCGVSKLQDAIDQGTDREQNLQRKYDKLERAYEILSTDFQKSKDAKAKEQGEREIEQTTKKILKNLLGGGLKRALGETKSKLKGKKKKKLDDEEEKEVIPEELLQHISLQELQELNLKIFKSGMKTSAKWDPAGRIRWQTTKEKVDRGTEFKWKNPAYSKDKMNSIGARIRDIATFLGKSYEQKSYKRVPERTSEARYWGVKLFEENMQLMKKGKELAALGGNTESSEHKSQEDQ